MCKCPQGDPRKETFPLAEDLSRYATSPVDGLSNCKLAHLCKAAPDARQCCGAGQNCRGEKLCAKTPVAKNKTSARRTKIIYPS